jgi:predicted RNA binding protein YcfA (HicA-like mRNA interferase family)
VFRVVVPLHDTLAKGTLSDILKRAGLSVEEFKALL